MAKRLEQGSLRELLGKEVRRRRTEAGLTQQQLGAIIHVVDSRIAQIETATGAKVTYDLCAALDAALKTGGLLTDLWEHIRRETYPNYVRRVLDLQQKALVIHQFSEFVPGLLQTEGYARALLKSGLVYSGGDLEEKVSSRLTRQAVLNGPNPPWYWAILDEVALYREFGGRQVVREQLAHVLDLAGRPSVHIQVLTFDKAEPAAVGGTLTIMELPDGGRMAYDEGITSGTLVEGIEDVRKYARVYDRVQANALPQDESAALIRKVMEERYPCPPPELT
ncbi:helix-turn-helix domain-containing protein [Streptantibioticus rubrisoli]|uniref:Helix-turn-helix domain-containing protein n=1 Tax=Streptantibioticus rubrisoli TaxID=1387313 RepID=A0ABT1PJE6_9ACTN|nr:helix-turn-helix transcriptional regulator [Streptantibioticus rubrisoli]MCQ4045489.1 helix-turn-helix domain-containing protein [Streptantibioticus rubrisoli]